MSGTGEADYLTYQAREGAPTWNGLQAKGRVEAIRIYVDGGVSNDC